jgi:FkbM family methyltransferase
MLHAVVHRDHRARPVLLRRRVRRVSCNLKSMGIGEKAEGALKRFVSWRKRRLPGAFGDFFRRGGNDLLVRELPISSEDLVNDAGGYEGSWIREILIRYGSRAIVFEPLPAQADSLRRLFQNNSRVEVIEAAIGNRNGEDILALRADASTRFAGRRHAASITIRVLDIADFLNSRGISEIGCMKLNIEGSEYEVLERLIENGLIGNVRSLLVQFHPVDADSSERRYAIQNVLGRSHVCNFDFPFVWERWTRALRDT